MSEGTNQAGQVGSTPEGGPLAGGVPAQTPGAGQVQATPEAGPLPEGEELKPPTWREHMSGPVLGLDDVPAASSGAAATQPSAAAAEPPAAEHAEKPSRREREASDELRKWPPYSGKPVSEVRWDAALKYAAPVVAQAEKLTIQAINLSARGLSQLAKYLEERRQQREADKR